ncbi:hypothetical protein LRP49_14600 [Enterovibrio sp. ZSDZ35]|uniref:Lipoprotein n=1 Tax=Enterovibrio qingdaonensis TaxID=2899818 RepID=A0ABT5QP68_9GAMM|nr:hypothetical protein [Enterovibrio sp. ZSDZ35]MDD1782399.1 hypothetical protein [Enterovibrio sp. ZSDZ35]
MRSAAAVLLCLGIVGCQSSLVDKLPVSNYQGHVPDKLNQELLTFNDVPIQSLRGETIHYIYEEDKALLTIVRKLRSARWNWDMNKSDISDDVRVFTCEQLGPAIDMGLGVRTWYAGSGGFVTDVIQAGDCDGLY